MPSRFLGSKPLSAGLAHERLSRERVFAQRVEFVLDFGEVAVSLYDEYRRLAARYLNRKLPPWGVEFDAEREVFLSVASWLLPNYHRITPVEVREALNRALAGLGWSWGPVYEPKRKRTPDCVPMVARAPALERVSEGLLDFLLSCQRFPVR